MLASLWGWTAKSQSISVRIAHVEFTHSPGLIHWPFLNGRARRLGRRQASLAELSIQGVNIIHVAVRSRTQHAIARKRRQMYLIAVTGHARVRRSVWAGHVLEVRDEAERRAVEVESHSNVRHLDDWHHSPYDHGLNSVWLTDV